MPPACGWCGKRGDTIFFEQRGSMETEVAKKLFTVEEYHRMGQAGIFHPEARLELIEGEIIEMSPVGDRHISCVNRATALFTSRLAGGLWSAFRTRFASADSPNRSPIFCWHGLAMITMRISASHLKTRCSLSKSPIRLFATTAIGRCRSTPNPALPKSGSRIFKRT